MSAVVRAGRARGRTAPRWVPYAFLSPVIVLFSLFFLAPIGYTGYLSLRKVQVSGLGLGSGARREVFAGLDNYRDALDAPHGSLELVSVATVGDAIAYLTEAGSE